MADNFIVAFNVIFPIFLQMLLGYGLRKKHLLDGPTCKKINGLVFKCLLPILIFSNIYNSDLTQEADPHFLLCAIGGVFAGFFLLMLLIPVIEKDPRKCGVMVQAGFRSNFVLFGIPVAVLLAGEGHTGPASILIAVIIPFYNALCVIALEHFRGGRANFKAVARGVITNPLIIASLIGIAVNLIGIRLPVCIESAVSSVSKSATPLALIVLGAEFELGAIREYYRQISITLAFKLLIFPAIFLSIAALLGFRGDQYIALLVLFSSPTAVNSYIMAEMMGGDGVLASQLVFYSTGFSLFTMLLVIFLSKTAGMF